MNSVNLRFNSVLSCEKDLEFKLSGSKSISHRILIINYLAKLHCKVQNLSNSEDTIVLLNALNSKHNTIQLNHSGTAMRFLISLFAYEGRDIVLEGDKFLLSRPISNLIENLNSLGADIIKVNNKIFIKSSKLIGRSLSFQFHFTSQYISSLLLVAPYIKNGIDITFDPNAYSKSYIDMTTSIMQTCGAKLEIHNNQIKVFQSAYTKSIDFIESDWTSASYLFLAFLFSKFQKIKIKFLHQASIQGDSVIIDFFSLFGVLSTFHNDTLLLEKKPGHPKPHRIEWNFSNSPDLFPTILVACFGLGVELLAHGVSTLIYKESNRIVSMKNELLKFNNSFLEIKTQDCVSLKPSNKIIDSKSISIDTYNDHRIALSLSPLSLLGFNLEIKNPNVINKSYPNFFNDLTKFGVLIE